MKNCSFTGHRSIPQNHIKPLLALIERAVTYAYREGCRNFYTGGALGFDTMCAKTVLKFRLSNPDARLILVLPCKTQAERWSERQRSMYEYILMSADEVIYTSEEYTNGCMRKRNEQLVKLCDILIAYSGRESSGSAQTVRMAKTLNKIVYNLYGSAENAN